MFYIIDKIFESALLIWYFYSLYDVAVDPTITDKADEIINVAFILMLCVTLFNYKIDNPLSWGILIGLVGWYFWFTYVDASNMEYSLKRRIFLVSIDILSIIYLLGTMLHALMTSSAMVKLVLNTCYSNCKETVKYIFA